MCAVFDFHRPADRHLARITRWCGGESTFDPEGAKEQGSLVAQFLEARGTGHCDSYRSETCFVFEQIKKSLHWTRIKYDSGKDRESARSSTLCTDVAPRIADLIYHLNARLKPRSR